MTTRSRGARLPRIVAAGMALVLAAGAAAGPAGVTIGVAAGSETTPAPQVLVAGDGPSVLRGIAAALRLSAVGPPGTDSGQDSCVRRQLLIGNRTYLNGRSQTIRWTPGAEQGLLLDREIWLRPAPAGALLHDVIRETDGSGWWRPAISAFRPGWMPGTSMATLSANTGVAAQQLAAYVTRAGRSTPDDVVRGALAVAGVQYLDEWQRAALLQALADVSGVVLVGERTDLAGRPGLAFRFINSPNLLTVLIDQRSGEILAATTMLPDLVLDDVEQLTTLYLERRRCSPPARTGQLAWPDNPVELFCCGGAA